MSVSLLSTKLYIPPLQAHAIARPRLTKKLLSGGHRPGTIIFISGPAGFGKTTLLSEFANEIKGSVAWVSLDEGDPAYRIFGFTAGHVSWPQGSRVGSGQSALEAYNTQIGVCGEFANLMTALCRACGIPARSIVGLAMPMFQVPLTGSTSTWNHPAGSHAWVEVYAGDEWMMADPSWTSRMPFDHLWYGRVIGRYLSYGELADHDRIYSEMIEWVGEYGEITAAMSAPVKFAASANGGQVEVTPVVSVRKGWDIRWIIAVGLYLAIVITASIVERRWKNKLTH